jgi:hypothetical protein
MDSKLLNEKGFTQETEEEKKINKINIPELLEENEKNKSKGDTFDHEDYDTADFEETELTFEINVPYFAVDEKGHVYPDEKSIRTALEKKGAMLFVFDGANLPYAYTNKKGKILKSEGRISSQNQLPGNSFTPMESPLPEDIVPQANANTYNKANDLYNDAKKLIDKNKDFVKEFEELKSDYTVQILKLEKDVEKLNALPKEPVLENGITKPKKPVPPVVPVAPVAPVPPVKPQIEEPKSKFGEMPKQPTAPGNPPLKPMKPIMPKKPEGLVDLEATKDLERIDYPMRKVEKPAEPVHPGPAPGYSRLVLFMSRLFLGRDSKAYTANLKYEAKLNAYESDMLTYPDRLRKYQDAEEVYQTEVQKFNYINELVTQRELTKSYNASMERYNANMEEYSKKLAEYEGELQKYEETVRNYEEEMKKYDAELKKYEKETDTLKKFEERDAEMLENNDYAEKMQAYDILASKYDIEFEKYQAENEQFKEKLAQYEKDANAYDKAIKQYEEDLRKYNDAVDKYPGGKEAYEKQRKEFLDGLKNAGYSLKEYHNIPKRLEDRRNKLAMTERNLEANKAKVAEAKKNLPEYAENLSDEISGYGENLSDVYEYRSHIEVRLEGIADLLQNEKFTRKNLFASTWILKNECENKSFKDPVAVEKLLTYVACRQAEKDILDKTSNYKVANPEAEGTILRNLNNQQTMERLKNDPMFTLILESQIDKPINPELIAKTYLNPPAEMKKLVQIREAQNSMKEMMGEIEQRFGNKPISKDCLGDYIQWKTFQRCMEDEKNVVSDVKGARTDFYSNTNPLSGTGRLSYDYKKTADQYKEAFNEVIKNQEKKEKEVKDFPESVKRMMRLKVNYTLKDLDEAVNRIIEKNMNAEAGKENQGPKNQIKQPAPVKH